MSKNITPTVSLGVPVDSVPNTDTRKTPLSYGKHWVKVAEGCRLYPGKWVPVTIDGLTAGRMKSVPSEIKNRKLWAFREDNWDACYRDGQLYISYQGKTVSRPLNIAI